jgi:DNA-binding NarL/FixJ family response regulator
MDTRSMSPGIGRNGVSDYNANGSRAIAAIQSLAMENDDFNGFVLLIDPRALDRECLSRSLTACNPDIRIMSASSAEEWRKRGMESDPSVIVLVLGGKKIGDPDVGEGIGKLADEFPFSPVVIVADTDDLCQIIKALECGARGFIPSSVGIDVAVEAIGLARAGGVFVPASSVLAMRELIHSAANGTHGVNSLFTPREAEVAEALRRGKANKIIAYELNLCESTVKVHIRNIMKKLNATNRTEVAYKIRETMR